MLGVLAGRRLPSWPWRHERADLTAARPGRRIMDRQQRAPRCSHQPRCPAPSGHDRTAARIIRAHPEQGWSLLCTGVIVFDDAGELLPDGTIIGPRFPA